MSYTKTNWQSGDIVSAEKLNKMEEGIAEGNSNLLIVDEWVDFTPWGFDYSVLCPKITARQAKEAIDAGKQIVLRRTFSETDNEIETVYTDMAYVNSYRTALNSDGSFTFSIYLSHTNSSFNTDYFQWYDWDEYLHPYD